MELVKLYNLSQTLKIIPRDTKISIQRDSSCCFRADYKKETVPLNMVQFDKILNINVQQNFIVVEPEVSGTYN